jgi:hypothetical protein
VATPRRQVLPRPGAAGPPPARPPEAAAPPEPSPSPAGIRVTLRSGDEGAEIYVEHSGLAGRILDGTLTLEAQAGSTLRVEKRKAGYHPDREQFQLGDQPVDLPLRPLRRLTRFVLELCYTSSQFLGLGAGFRWYPVPDRLMVRADAYGYVSAGSAFHQDLRLALGTYLFFSPERRLRAGLASGLGLIVSALDSAAHRDWYWDIAELWLELGWDRWALFLRAEAKYALGNPGGLLERGFLTGYGPQYTLGWLWKW